MIGAIISAFYCVESFEMTAGTENYGGRNECKPFFQDINLKLY